MTTPTYTPRAGSLASQVISFFRNNPDEELLLEDITDKFAATRGNVHTLLSDAVKAELLARERNADGDYLYKPGRACGTYAPPDVTIAAADVGSLERLTAAEPELRHELAALGAEVEAIRVELRAEQGADKGPERGAAGNNLSQSGEDGGRQGDRMMRQNDSGQKDWGQKDWGDGQGRQRVEARRQRASLGSEAPGLSARLSGAGRIDRYA